ncbi:M15 family metallopeptidase [Mastigocoleus sp. MO_188.B34]|uniref:M15 family metallopeptidase n=1 Tax=Mastigocoleus sp. MO_188.B34 TaxID=3036635 RepID=UPI002619B6AC|nr:M15 family metallopeptidase [Mastigocoleus sp. MO_188.B34]MDJ0694728.1 M15 family metallopeptidase [Mastigocoleus sp. MO_188.B34]
MRPYHKIPIVESNEPLIEIPLEKFALESPHPYIKLGAPYGEYSPYFLRKSVVERLITAQNHLCQLFPEWRIQIFDAYRPVAVQEFMVNYSFKQALQERKLEESELSSIQVQALWEEVYKIWATPSLDKNTPPPHSTGAAVDVTLVNERGQIINMGSPIDELSDRSLPDYYALGDDSQSQDYHAKRKLLCSIMEKAGFCRNPREWWHFSFGDQMWAWLNNQVNSGKNFIACYGRVV